MNIINVSDYMTKEEAADPGPIDSKRMLLFGIRLWQEEPEARIAYENLTEQIMVAMGLVTRKNEATP